MSDAAEQSPADASGHALVPVHRWPGRIRWFLSEFLVIVAGVLVALAVNAWWQGRQDRQVGPQARHERGAFFSAK